MKLNSQVISFIKSDFCMSYIYSILHIHIALIILHTKVVFTSYLRLRNYFKPFTVKKQAYDWLTQQSIN